MRLPRANIFNHSKSIVFLQIPAADTLTVVSHSTLTQDMWAGHEITSPPLRPVGELHMPRTDVRAEEFVLGRTGIVCSLDDSGVKRISSVAGACYARVCVCVYLRVCVCLMCRSLWHLCACARSCARVRVCLCAHAHSPLFVQENSSRMMTFLCLLTVLIAAQRNNS